MSEKRHYSIIDIINHLRIQFDIPEQELAQGPTSDDRTPFRANLEKKIMREMDKYRITVEDGNGKKRYLATETEMNMLIDYVFLPYLKNQYFGNAKDEYFKEKDELENKRLAEAEMNFIEAMKRDPDYLEESLSVDGEEIEKSIDRIMLRTLFEQYYTFDYKQYRKDYQERYALATMSSPFVEPGFTELNEKLSDPVKYYCTKRK